MFGFVCIFFPARLLACPLLSVSAWFRIVSIHEGRRMFMRGVGRYASAGRRCDLAVRLSCRSIRPVPSVRSIFPYRLAGGMRAPFLSARFLASSVGGGSYRFTYRLVPRLACPSRGDVSWLFFEARPPSRCLVLFGVSSCGPPFSSLVFSSRPPVSLSSPHSLVSPGGSLPRLVVSVRVLRLVLFCSHRISLVASHDRGDGGGSSFSSRGGVPHPRCFPLWNPIWRWRRRDRRSVRRYKIRAVFVSSFPPSGHRGEDDGAIWIRPQGR